MHDGINMALALQSAHLSIGTLISQQARKTPHHIALKDAHKSCSYQEFDRRTSQFANFLLSEGIRRGDRAQRRAAAPGCDGSGPVRGRRNVRQHDRDDGHGAVSALDGGAPLDGGAGLDGAGRRLRRKGRPLRRCRVP